MAYIPDEAVYDSDQLSDSAFKTYCLLCARRNHRHETTIATASTVVRMLGLSKATVYRSLHELEQKAWIERKGNVYRPLKGDFSPMNNRYNGSLKIETKSLRNETPQSHQRDSHNITTHKETSVVLPNVIEATGPIIDRMHEEATNGRCWICQDTGVIVWKDGSLRTCKCQPTLFEA